MSRIFSIGLAAALGCAAFSSAMADPWPAHRSPHQLNAILIDFDERTDFRRTRPWDSSPSWAQTNPSSRWDRGYGGGYWDQGYGGFRAPPSRSDDLLPSRAAPHRYPNLHLEWCFKAFRSYRRTDNTFLHRDGTRKECISPYG